MWKETWLHGIHPLKKKKDAEQNKVIKDKIFYHKYNITHPLVIVVNVSSSTDDNDDPALNIMGPLSMLLFVLFKLLALLILVLLPL